MSPRPAHQAHDERQHRDDPVFLWLPHGLHTEAPLSLVHGGAAIYMPDWYRECKRLARSGGAITLSGLSLLAPVELGIQFAGTSGPAPIATIRRCLRTST
jgi:hypothetical protein